LTLLPGDLIADLVGGLDDVNHHRHKLPVLNAVVAIDVGFLHDATDRSARQTKVGRLEQSHELLLVQHPITIGISLSEHASE
jgi:hypothetical protein